MPSDVTSNNTTQPPSVPAWDTNTNTTLWIQNWRFTNALHRLKCVCWHRTAPLESSIYWRYTS